MSASASNVPITAIVNIHKNSLSRTIATYFQSSRTLLESSSRLKWNFKSTTYFSVSTHLVISAMYLTPSTAWLSSGQIASLSHVAFQESFCKQKFRLATQRLQNKSWSMVKHIVNIKIFYLKYIWFINEWTKRRMIVKISMKLTVFIFQSHTRKPIHAKQSITFIVCTYTSSMRKSISLPFQIIRMAQWSILIPMFWLAFFFSRIMKNRNYFSEGVTIHLLECHSITVLAQVFLTPGLLIIMIEPAPKHYQSFYSLYECSTFGLGTKLAYFLRNIRRPLYITFHF